jgi:hypothetical protein
VKLLLIAFALVGALSLAVRAQGDARPIVRVGERVLTTADLERVKTLLPLERFKTSIGRTWLIDALYVEFLIAQAKLEAAGMAAVTPEEVERQAQQLLPSSTEPDAAGYTPQTRAERTVLALKVRGFLAARAPRPGNAWFAPQSTGTPEDAGAARERQITSSVTPTMLPLMRVRSMLLPNARVANKISARIRSEADFIAEAQRHSLVRREVAGAYAAEDRPVAVTQLEPELQIALLGTEQTGLLRVTAPFGRVWLVYRTPMPKPSANLSISFFTSLTQPVSGPVYFGVGTFDPKSLIEFLIADTTPVTFLDSTVEPRNPVIAEVGTVRMRLSDYFVAKLLGEVNPGLNESFFAAGPQSPIAQFVTAWLEARSITTALPYNGAGTEAGLEAYIAARAKVSETQLKYFYWQQRDNYLYSKDERVVTCEFDNAELARKWRDTVLFAPYEIWGDFARNGVGVRCTQDASLTPPTLLASPSRATLTPIAGGYITGIVAVGGKASFVLRYGFHPDPIRKPFLLARDAVQRSYRKLVAAKRLEAFKAELLTRAGAKNTLAEAVAALEQR